MIDENYESLYQYFSQINYTLERGNEYFYFSRTESKTTLEQKILRAYYWIDVLDFFKTYDETFGAGFRFQPEQILVEANINVLLQNKLDGIRKHFSDKDIRKDVLDNMIRLLAKESFIELENEKTNTYKVLTSWHYLEKLVDSINILKTLKMRNLSRIIFINSANIPYSDNIYLDGNIHFIGTQGVGKSTILRAILFFYNADTQKLGIPLKNKITRTTIFLLPTHISFTK